MRTAEPRLRLFDPDHNVASFAPKMKRIRFQELVNVLAEAVRNDRTWLSDFGDDDVKISTDLYEVLKTYRRLRPSA